MAKRNVRGNEKEGKANLLDRILRCTAGVIVLKHELDRFSFNSFDIDLQGIEKFFKL